MSNNSDMSTEKIEFRPRVRLSKLTYDRLKKEMEADRRATEGELISVILERRYENKPQV